jgi:uncharacterized protein YdaU (DUF1376 family)
MGRAWMPLYVGDYLRDTRDLSTLQHGAYLLLIMHYWQHDALPGDDARLAAITGLSVAQWRRIREPVQAKFAEGWRHKRIEAEIARIDRAFMQRRLAGRNGGIKSGIARAVAQGEAIIRGEAKGKRALERSPSGLQADGQAQSKRPRTNHNHNYSSFSSASFPSDNATAPAAPAAGVAAAEESARPKPANQWSRQELDALFARRTGAGAPAAGSPVAEAPDAIRNDGSSDKSGG